MSVITCPDGKMVRGNTSKTVGYDCVGKIDISPGTNVFLGENSGLSNIGVCNTAVGQLSLKSVTSGSYNTAIGYDTLSSNQTGHQNVAIGFIALKSNTSGNENLGIGGGSLANNTIGGNNVSIGYESLRLSATLSNNLAVGNTALRHIINGSNNTAVGTNSMLTAYTSCDKNTAIGHSSLKDLVTGTSNISIGTSSAQSCSVMNNTIVIGSYAGTGDNQYKENMIIIGNHSKAESTSSNKSIIIGYNTKSFSNNQIVIGCGETSFIGKPGEPNATYIKNIFNTSVPNGIPVVINYTSKLGVYSFINELTKQNVKPIDNDITSKLLALRPVEFTYKSDPEKFKQYGLIAEEVFEIFPDLVFLHTDQEKEEKKPYSIRYELLSTLLLNEYIKIHSEKKDMKDEIDQILFETQEILSKINDNIDKEIKIQEENNKLEIEIDKVLSELNAIIYNYKTMCNIL